MSCLIFILILIKWQRQWNASFTLKKTWSFPTQAVFWTLRSSTFLHILFCFLCPICLNGVQDFFGALKKFVKFSLSAALHHDGVFHFSLCLIYLRVRLQLRNLNLVQWTCLLCLDQKFHVEGHHDFLHSCDVFLPFLAIQSVIPMVCKRKMSCWYVWLKQVGGLMGNLSKNLETDELCAIFDYSEQIHQQSLR